MNTNNYQYQKDLNYGHFNHRSESFFISTTILLFIALSHKTSFIMIQTTIRFYFDREDPLTSNKLYIRWLKD